MAKRQTKAGDEMIVNESAAKFDRIRRAHQSEVAEDYVEMIAELIVENGEARTVDLAARFGVTSPTVNAIIQRLAREDLVETKPYRSIFLTERGMALAEASRQRHKIVRDFLVSIGARGDRRGGARVLSIAARKRWIFSPALPAGGKPDHQEAGRSRP